MLTDEMPSNWHDDDYIRAWAVARGLNRYPRALVALMNANRDGPDTAEIEFGTPGNPVRRFKMQRLALETLAEYQKASLAICEHAHVDFGRCTYCDAEVPDKNREVAQQEKNDD